METTQEKLAQTQRHGYAVFTKEDILIGWVLTLQLGREFPTAHHLRNVQNDAPILI